MNGETQDLNNILCLEEQPSPTGVVIFGASGDLSYRKLVPSLYRLFRRGVFPANFFLLGYARSQLTTADYRRDLKSALTKQLPAEAERNIDEFLQLCFYQAGDYHDANAYRELSTTLERLDDEFGTGRNLVFYLSVPPALYIPIVDNLAAEGLFKESDNPSVCRRLVLEKPFGYDLASSRQLNQRLLEQLSEKQIYRIDHYLGKETVQNILMLRFANAVFEPVWNRQYIDNVQITVAEDIGVGNRAGYFDRTGIFRDIFQNHMIQLLSLITMEMPTAFTADDIRSEKNRLLRCVKPFNSFEEVRNSILRGQYTAGNVGDALVAGYREEAGITASSTTETYCAARLYIDNWRWHGVPFYMRVGKRMERKTTQVSVSFQRVPYSIFQPLQPEHLSPNILTFKIQPDEGVKLSIQAKRPGAKICLSDLDLEFSYKEAFNTQQPEAYERLLLDVMNGDQTLFMRHDNIDRTWALMMPVLDFWQDQDTQGAPDLLFYPAGSWGPEEAEGLVKQTGHRWILK
ncbi:MAG: glucose-6-phosphate dehydrogenase [Lentisphaeria bacterium]